MSLWLMLSAGPERWPNGGRTVAIHRPFPHIEPTGQRNENAPNRLGSTIRDAWLPSNAAFEHSIWMNSAGKRTNRDGLIRRRRCFRWRWGWWSVSQPILPGQWARLPMPPFL